MESALCTNVILYQNCVHFVRNRAWSIERRMRRKHDVYVRFNMPTILSFPLGILSEQEREGLYSRKVSCQSVNLDWNQSRRLWLRSTSYLSWHRIETYRKTMKADVYWDGRIGLNFPRNSNDARRNVPIFYPTEGQNYFSSVCREKMSWPGED